MPFSYSYRLPVVLGTVSLVVLLSLSALVQAETKTIVSEATYSMGDGETPSSAEAMVLQKAKQRALEEAGTYVESYTHVRNLDLTIDEIKTIAGGVMKTEIVEQNRALEGSGTRFYIKIRALVTTDKIVDLARRKQLGPLVAENKRLQEDVAKLTRDLEDFKRQILQSKTESEREVVLEKIREVEKQFRQVRSTETALYRRLVSGEELSAQVEKAFQEEQRRRDVEQRQRERQRESLERVLTTLKSNGHTITIGLPETDVSLDQPDTVALRFVVTAEASKEAKSVIHDLHEAYEADLPDDAAARIDEVLDRLTLVLTVSLKDGREYVSKQQRIHNYRSPRSWDLNQIVRNGPTVAYITVPIPRSVVSQVASVEGKIEVQAEPVAQPQRAAKRSSVSDDLNRELEEELKKIKQFQPAAKLDIPAVMTPKTTLKENGDDDTASDELIQGSGNARIGKSIFNGKGVCFNCHGPSGVIGRIPANIAAVISQFNPKPSNFKNPQSLRLTTDKQRFRAIKYGIRETGMVAMTHISDEEIIHVLAYLKTLREEATNKPDAQ